MYKLGICPIVVREFLNVRSTLAEWREERIEFPTVIHFTQVPAHLDFSSGTV